MLQAVIIRVVSRVHGSCKRQCMELQMASAGGVAGASIGCRRKSYKLYRRCCKQLLSELEASTSGAASGNIGDYKRYCGKLQVATSGAASGVAGSCKVNHLCYTMDVNCGVIFFSVMVGAHGGGLWSKYMKPWGHMGGCGVASGQRWCC
jgi:hypothetical protein